MIPGSIVLTCVKQVEGIVELMFTLTVIRSEDETCINSIELWHGSHLEAGIARLDPLSMASMSVAAGALCF